MRLNTGTCHCAEQFAGTKAKLVPEKARVPAALIPRTPVPLFQLVTVVPGGIAPPSSVQMTSIPTAMLPTTEVSASAFAPGANSRIVSAIAT